MENKTERLGKEKISKLLFNLSAPATVGMLVIALYNIVDTIFVGRYVGTLAIAGISVVFPIQMIITTMGQTVGVGSASIISRRLGAENKDEAEKVFGNLVILIIGCGFLLVCIGYIFIEPVLIIFGAQGEIYQSAYDYFLIMLPTLFLLNISIALNNIIRAEGRAKEAMFSMVIASVANIILDPIFIVYYDLGIKGAAWATVISQIFTFLYLFYFFKSGKSTLKLKTANLKLNKSITEETFAIGISSSARHGAQGLLAAILNNALVAHGGEIAVAAYGIISRIVRVAFLPMIGLVQGFMPIAGYNYGSKTYLRVRKVLTIANIWITLFCLFCFALLVGIPETLVSVFSKDKELISLGSHAMRIAAFAFPLIGFQMIGAAYYQAIGKAGPAMFLALLRQIILLIPLVLILPQFIGLDGLWYSFPIADILAAIVTAFMLFPEFKKLKSFGNSSAHSFEN